MKNNGVAESWQYFEPSQLRLCDTDVKAIQKAVGAFPDGKIGKETIYNMCAYIFKDAILKDKGIHWYDQKWYEREKALKR